MLSVSFHQCIGAFFSLLLMGNVALSTNTFPQTDMKIHEPAVSNSQLLGTGILLEQKAKRLALHLSQVVREPSAATCRHMSPPTRWTYNHDRSFYFLW